MFRRSKSTTNTATIAYDAWGKMSTTFNVS